MTNIVEIFDNILWYFEKAQRNAPNNQKTLESLKSIIEANQKDLEEVLSHPMHDQLNEIKQYIKENINVNSQ